MLFSTLPLWALAGALLWHGPIAQDASYHQFADQRTWFGVAHGQNTWSNVPFFLAGLLALSRIRRCPTALKQSALTMAFGLLGVAVGSTWYHLAPTDQTLVWDRLPMSIAFAAALALIASDRVDTRIRAWLWLLVVLAVGSIGLWVSTGDLRAYALIQFGSLLLMIQCLVFGTRGQLQVSWVWMAVACYVVAKGFEASDAWWWQFSGHQVGGHMLKHLAAGLGALSLALAIPNRERPGLGDRQS